MIDFGIKTKTPRVKFDAPDDPTFWKAVAIQGQKEIRQRTESEGKDPENKSFKPYQKAYAEHRMKKGRSARPNLSFTGKMLGGMIAIGRKGVAIIRLTGEQGFKAFQNEENDREFFALSDKQVENIFKGVSKWLTRKNNLK